MKKWDVFIVGGGLAGLTAAIHLSANNLNVALIEKEKFPHHKVCGEYLSKEIIPYLKSLSLDLAELSPVEISELEFSSQSGKSIRANLKMGGLGISRYALDHYFYKKALEAGCTIFRETVDEIKYNDDSFTIKTLSNNFFTARFVLGAYGKRSNLDINLKRDFVQKKSGWLAIKAHYKNDSYPKHLVSLHNFNGGYCGLSKTEIGVVNVCYLATYKSFKKHKSPEEFRNSVLRKNPKLNEFFSNAQPVFEKDLSIAQISFDKKRLIDNHILMLGDAAGLIHPLCGNGMAMAIHSAKLAAEELLKYFNNTCSREEVELSYGDRWNANFKSRLRMGRVLQRILLSPKLAEVSHKFVNTVPFLLPMIIKTTHGKAVA